MPLFKTTDPFHIVAGGAPIVVGAPHHGTRPNVEADLGTGPIALALAHALDARAVIVSDLRRTVDVNKDPLRLGANVRQHALRYQNELFRAGPRLILEIHGHVSGQYAVEITTGFDLDATAPGDARFLEKLAALKQALAGALSARLGHAPTLGLYPLDRDVKKTATDTFTFQKIRRARNLVGFEWYGLHIELNAPLRLKQSADFVESLAGAFAASLRAAFDPLPLATALIPIRADQSTDTLLTPRTLSVTRAPEKHLTDNLALVHPDELTHLGALDGDTVILRNGYEEIQSRVAGLKTLRPGQVALPARIRRQINLNEHERVTIGRPGMRSTPTVASSLSGFVVGEIRPARADCLWLAPAELSQLGLRPDAPLTLQGRPETESLSAVSLQTDPALSPRTAALSSSLTERLKLTLGEVVMLKPSVP